MGPAGFQTKPGKGGKDDVGKALEVVDQEGKEADVEDLADQLGKDVVVARQRPEQAGQGNVDGDQNAGQEGDVAGEHAEPAIDVAAEGFREAVDDGEVVHAVFSRQSFAAGATGLVTPKGVLK